jgi:hypothetical protein
MHIMYITYVLLGVKDAVHVMLYLRTYLGAEVEAFLNAQFLQDRACSGVLSAA